MLGSWCWLWSETFVRALRESTHAHEPRASFQQSRLRVDGLLPGDLSTANVSTLADKSGVALPFSVSSEVTPVTFSIILLLVKAVTNLPRFNDRWRVSKNYLANSRAKMLFGHQFSRGENWGTEILFPPGIIEQSPRTSKLPLRHLHPLCPSNFMLSDWIFHHPPFVLSY